MFQMSKLEDFIKNNKHYFESALIIILIICSFWYGRHSVPTKIEYKDKIVTVIKEVQVVKTVEVAQKTTDKQKQTQRRNNIRRDVTVEKKPDGTVITHTVVTDQSTSGTESDTKVSDSKKLNIDSTTSKETTKTEEHTKLVEHDLKLDWALSARAGYYLPGLRGHNPDFNLVPYKGIILEVSLERRIVGPFWAGPWVSSMGAAGLGASVVW